MITGQRLMVFRPLVPEREEAASVLKMYQLPSLQA